MNLDESLEQKAVSGVERGIVVAAEQTEGRQAHRRADALGAEPLRHPREASLGKGERRDDIREHCRGAVRPHTPLRTKKSLRGLLSVPRCEIKFVEAQQQCG